ncbi:TapB family protein [Dyadobacter psychrotolerans]|uniref:DUF3108 domain-containing protein n=1 Tax=Dyadobacter psychrotolerans TaxID=2541721 RepID=A0A4R5DUU6_9BACT|nr:hypothetical protein [Dyadobacter psychrotolerans]TDE18229.1 hypothetical protein E0F88_01410 [Dyadobacter psychrotolerans]
MMKNILLSFLLVMVGVCTLKAQDCMGFNMKAGSGFDMNSYDAKGKLITTMRYKIANVSNEAGAVVYTIDFESVNSKGKSEMKNTYKMRCKGNTLSMDAKSLISSEQMKSLESFQMKFTSDDIEYPAKLTVGEKLKDASLKGEGTSGPLAITTNMLIFNRKVESQEKLTIPAGTFDAYKVTSDMTMESQMGMKIKLDFQTVSYRAPNILWDLKTESYRKGKLVGTTELSKIY